MDIREILKKVDHTYLKQYAVWEDIKRICDEGMKYGTASVCIPPSFVKKAERYTNDRIKICTVIGFPNGYSTTKAKVYETEDALEKGADEIDMVINIGNVKEGNYIAVENEIRDIKAVCRGRILKVIVETCMLTEEEKIKMCRIVTETGADYIKTSTGFGGGGATFEDVALFKKHVGQDVKIKAAGGISSIADAQKFIQLGADRLGTSRIVDIVKKEGLM